MSLVSLLELMVGWAIEGPSGVACLGPTSWTVPASVTLVGFDSLR